MKKIILALILAVFCLGANAQSKIQKQEIHVGIVNIENHFGNNKPSLNLPKITYYANIKGKTYYTDFLWTPYKGYSFKRLASEGDVSGRRYVMLGIGKSFIKRINKNTIVNLNTGIKLRGGLQSSLGDTRWICVMEDINYLYTAGLSVGAQSTYYFPNKHWGVGAEVQYSRFLSQYSPNHFFSNVGLSYRFSTQ